MMMDVRKTEQLLVRYFSVKCKTAKWRLHNIYNTFSFDCDN
jgi:hypothetical protein